MSRVWDGVGDESGRAGGAVSTQTASRLSWTHDFIVIDGDMIGTLVLPQIEKTTAHWVVISRFGGIHLYAFTIEELWQLPLFKAARESGSDWRERPFADTLGLHEDYSSTPAESRRAPPPIDLSWRRSAPSIYRYIEVGPDQKPRAIGGIDATADPRAPEDEGTTPVRYPSIESDKPLAASSELTVTVDLSRAAVPETQGEPLSFGLLPANWEKLDLSVVLACEHIDFEGEGRGIVTIFRNADSTPASIKGRVHADAPSGGTVRVTGNFFHGTRFCGAAARWFTLAVVANPHTTMTAAASVQTRGTVVVEPAAQPPDLTVRIWKNGGSGNLDWLVETSRFDGLPPKLRAKIDLGHSTEAEVADLFNEFAILERGQHGKRIEGFGSRLWDLAPQMFKEVYWALWDHYGRRLTIQFISDELHLPWELMRPVRPDESEIHPPLALKHAVARWIERWDGYMRNWLPGGGVFTIAPKYATASRRLPRAQTESQTLEAQFGAQRVDGTRLAVTTLLETATPVAPVALLHFAGHGQFRRTATTESNIKLEDGTLAASEIGRPEIRLGKSCRTLVFFNACEVGATGSIFGEVGGWADAFLGRQFGGFIAPLWSVDDEDASVVAVELLEGILKQHQPIDDLLRAVREKHGDVSPTFYSYLYYGDVTARLAA